MPAALLVADLVGVAVFALSGALLAVRKELDVLGALVLGLLTALGGGLLRDVLLGDLPPAALRDQRYLLVALLASLAGWYLHPAVSRLGRPFVLLDAAGLALFAVTGTAKALDAGLAVAPVVLLGAMTAAGGGILRDVVVRDVPLVLRPGELYVLAAMAGSIVVIVADAAGVPRVAAGALGGLVCLGLRLASVLLGWRTSPPR